MEKFVLPNNNENRNSQERIDAFVEVLYKERNIVPCMGNLLKYSDGTYEWVYMGYLGHRKKSLPYECINPNYEEIQAALQIFKQKGYHAFFALNQKGYPWYFVSKTDDSPCGSAKRLF